MRTVNGSILVGVFMAFNVMAQHNGPYPGGSGPSVGITNISGETFNNVTLTGNSTIPFATYATNAGIASTATNAMGLLKTSPIHIVDAANPTEPLDFWYDSGTGNWNISNTVTGVEFDQLNFVVNGDSGTGGFEWDVGNTAANGQTIQLDWLGSSANGGWILQNQDPGSPLTIDSEAGVIWFSGISGPLMGFFYQGNTPSPAWNLGLKNETGGKGIGITNLYAPTGVVIISNAWSLISVTNDMPIFSGKFASSNGVPVWIYNSNGIAIVNYLSNPGGGIIP